MQTRIRTFIIYLLMLVSINIQAEAIGSGVRCSSALRTDLADKVAAENYLNKLVGRSEPIKFNEAIEYALLSLTEGPLKDSFISNLEKNILNSDITSLNSIKGLNWQSKKARTPEQFLKIVFKAVQLVQQTEFRPVTSASVYLKKRDRSLTEFATAAENFLRVQYDIFNTSRDFTGILLPTDNNALSRFHQFRRIFLNILWVNRLRSYKGLTLTQEVVTTLEAGGSDALNAFIRKKYGPELAVEWYVAHQRNISTAAMLSMAVVLVPALTNASIHQYEIETLQSSKIDPASIHQAQLIIKKSTHEIIKHIQATLAQPQREGLNPEEVEFLNEVNQSLQNTVIPTLP